MDYQHALEKLALGNNGLYMAGHPGYKRNFSRDSLVYGLLATDKESLFAQINHSAKYQGKKANPETGEEPGKIHHELPAGNCRGRPTTYNACDTNAWFLISAALLIKYGYPEIASMHKGPIERAIVYIRSHIEDGLFTEDPATCGADNFALRVTYWKDSVLASDHEEPHYPIVYSLVHFQNAYALQLIGKALDQPELVSLGDIMKKLGIQKLWRGDHFVTAIDDTDIDPMSSDSLHSLLYIDQGELPRDYAQSICNYSQKLETKAGYLSGLVGSETDDYHTRYVWVFEQALLHAAAKKHTLRPGMAISERIVDYLDANFPELIDSQNGFRSAGNNPQLWSIGARKYFEDTSHSFIAKI